MFDRWITIDNRKSALLIGPRRAGKTTLLKKRYPAYRYATLDDLDFLQWGKSDPKGLVLELGTHAIIDEIQRLPRLTIAVKYAIDNQGAHILMTGSSALGLLDAAADTLAGRITLLSLPAACWGENLGRPDHSIFKDRINPLQIMEAQRRLPRAITYGQFPEVLCLKNEQDMHDVLANYRDTYFTRDLMQLSNIENLDGLTAIFAHLARSIGSHLDVSAFAREAGVSHPTAKKYLNSLLQSQLTFKLPGYQYGPAKRYIKAAKTYFADNGIIHSLNIALNQGQLLENFVISELEKRRKLGFIRADRFFYYKSAAGREIDLVFEVDGKIVAVEIKCTKKPGRKDIGNLTAFAAKLSRPTELYLFYLGNEYMQSGPVSIIPTAALFRGR
jgi:predicted AAA+ superfamily ATPase